MNVIKHLRRLHLRSYTAILIALLALLVARPLAHHLHLGRWLVELALAAVLAASTTAMAKNRWGLIAAAALGIPAIVGRILVVFMDQPPPILVILIFSFTALFMVSIVVSMAQHVLSATSVTGDILRGAICIYLLLGYTWAVTYGFLDTIDPNSFSFAAHFSESASAQGRFNLLTYFSFVTITTLGFGDISPISPIARNLVWLEAVAGQLFVAIAIARLVAQQMVQSTRSQRQDTEQD